MTGRDRIVVIVCVVLVVLAAAWLEVVSPERQQASKLSAQVATAKSHLQSAEGKLASARVAESHYSTAYAAMVSLGKAVPPSQEVPSLMYQLEQTTTQRQVDFTSIGTGTNAGASASSTVTAPAAGSSSSSATSAFTQMPFTFVFEGTFFDLEHLFRSLTGFTTRDSAGDLQVSGRLLTIQSVKLSPTESSSNHGVKGSLTGTITATAYTAPAGQAPTGAAIPAAPAGSAASATSTTGASSSPNAPAIVRVTP